MGLVVQGRHQDLHRPLHVRDWGRDMLDDGAKQGDEIRCEVVRRVPGAALTGNGIDDRIAQLGILGRQFEEEIGNFLDDFLGPRILAVDLVDHDQRAQSELQRKPKDEPGLGQRTFGRVHKE